MDNPATSMCTAHAIMAKALKDAARRQQIVQGLSKVLADIMQELHGGSFSVDINHRTQFVTIAQDKLAQTGGASCD